jgi:two-component system, LuxR family, sensor kinase FixL
MLHDYIQIGRPPDRMVESTSAACRNPMTEAKRKHRTTKDTALAASEHRLQAVLDAAVDAIITIDYTGEIESFNEAAERMFGYCAPEVIGCNVSVLMGSPYREQHDDYVGRYLRTREPRVIGQRRDFTARRKDGTTFPVQVSVNEIPELELFAGVVRDITEQRMLQQEIVRIATAEQRRIGDELHDTTQQELAGLGLLAQNLADNLRGQNLAAEHALAQKIASGIAATNRHVRSLAKGLVPVPVDAEGLMTALANLAERTGSEHGVSCRFVCPRPVRIADDSAALHLYRIAQEAVLNAVRHAAASEISIHLERTDLGLRIDVRDDGIGIDEKRRGDGLGLRIMEHRCGLMGGTFSARRRARRGTVIRCTVPLLAAGMAE